MINIPLMKAIKAKPDDDLPRLVYADWLEELQTEHSVAHANFIRVSCMQAKAEAKLGKSKNNDPGYQMGRLMGYCRELKIFDVMLEKKDHDTTCPMCLGEQVREWFTRMGDERTKIYSTDIWGRGFMHTVGLASLTEADRILPGLLPRHPIQHIRVYDVTGIEIHLIPSYVTVLPSCPVYYELRKYVRKRRLVEYVRVGEPIPFQNYELFQQILSDFLLDKYRS